MMKCDVTVMGNKPQCDGDRDLPERFTLSHDEKVLIVIVDFRVVNNGKKRGRNSGFSTVFYLLTEFREHKRLVPVSS